LRVSRGSERDRGSEDVGEEWSHFSHRDVLPAMERLRYR
jgi:hypothetical protein